MEQSRVLDRDLLHRRWLAGDLDRLRRVVVSQSIVEILGRAGVADIEKEVVEEDLLLVIGVGLGLAVQGDSLSGLAEEKAVKDERSSVSKTRYIERARTRRTS